MIPLLPLLGVWHNRYAVGVGDICPSVSTVEELFWSAVHIRGGFYSRSIGVKSPLKLLFSFAPAPIACLRAGPPIRLIPRHFAHGPGGGVPETPHTFNTLRRCKLNSLYMGSK